MTQGPSSTGGRLPLAGGRDGKHMNKMVCVDPVVLLSFPSHYQQLSGYFGTTVPVFGIGSKGSNGHSSKRLPCRIVVNSRAVWLAAKGTSRPVSRLQRTLFRFSAHCACGNRLCPRGSQKKCNDLFISLFKFEMCSRTISLSESLDYAHLDSGPPIPPACGRLADAHFPYVLIQIPACQCGTHGHRAQSREKHGGVHVGL